MSNKPRIGISIGDTNGIGPEVIAKCFSDQRMLQRCTPVVFASGRFMELFQSFLAETPIHVTRDFSQLNEDALNVFACWDEEVPLQPGILNELGGKYAIRSLMVATQCLKDAEVDVLVTAPIHKANTHLPDFPFTGHTPFLKEKFGAKDVLMLLCNNRLRVALATEHVPVQEVSSRITAELLQSKLSLLRDTLVKDFSIERPRIAVLGLNPHSGDEGQIGREEIEVIRPLLEQLRDQGQLIFGTYSADAFFARGHYQHFDAVLAMYHDQGLIPFKTLADGDGVNFTAGLPVIRCSPDHGTAFDIAGQGIADPSSFREAVFMAIDLWRNRRDYLEATANPLQRGKLQKERH
ncbi:MAG: 4-hydroxythreonine-4-phosphate dehydrogenase PdxA [Bacteroidetes bacterium]|nr:4-hydroxythreonine-4-phosphate dehydrogenase PdxA [Bacteroidota bacterium]MBS1630777.1 4-hydroxythreonine-4-phosphate dehydrogenase PdxA [Bacteroidota bacterium]